MGLKDTEIKGRLKKENFDTSIDGKQAGLYWIEGDGIKVALTNYGGRIVGLWVRDSNGEMIDVVVGMGSTADYINSSEPYFGATIGRVGNRIARGTFILDCVEYRIPTNNNGHTLHGGEKGFQGVVWDVEQPDNESLIFRYTSPDMEEGFPGNLKVKVIYSLAGGTSIKMRYEATTDKATPVNLTNHSFFNLNGEGSGTILKHLVKINAESFTPVDKGLIPTGEIRGVEKTPLDFREFYKIGERIDTQNEQLENGAGYDHNYVLVGRSGQMKKAATAIGDKSGIKMEVLTEEPAIQFYSGNFMESRNTLKSGSRDDYRTAFAIETQHFPDAPNQPHFPSIILQPGEIYETVSEYRFSTKR